MQLLIKLTEWIVKFTTLFFISISVSAEIQSYQLDNGLRLIVKPDHRAPVAVTQVWYGVGSSYEYNGITGISHQLEHMMFKGTKQLAPNEFSKIIAANGGRENAFTGRDYTAYFQTMEASRIEVSFRLEADRMRNLVIDETELLKERDVVAEERRLRTEDNPIAKTREAFYASAFMNSPYHHPIVGWMADIQQYQVADLEQWYQKWYAPNNAIIVVVGDVEPAAVFQLAQQYFGHLSAEEVATVKPQREVPQLGQRYTAVHAPAELPYLMMGWKVPVVATAEQTWEPYALEVLASVLDGGNSARLSTELVRKQQVAATAQASYSLFSRLDEVFIIAGIPSRHHEISDLKQAIQAQVERLKTELMSEAELARIKAQVVANSVYERDSVFYQAMQIGMLATVGLDWRLSEQYVEHIQAITAEQVQAVAKRYLIDKTLTIAELVPEAISATQSVRQVSKQGGRHAH